MVEKGTIPPEKSTTASGRGGSHGMASPHSPGRLHIESKSDSSSSASVSVIRADFALLYIGLRSSRVVDQLSARVHEWTH